MQVQILLIFVRSVKNDQRGLIFKTPRYVQLFFYSKIMLNIKNIRLITIAIAILTILAHFLNLDAHLLIALRWLTVASVTAWAYLHNSQTGWIFAAIIIGAVVGNDFPQVGLQLDILSKIFLKLIKSIVAPLLFATLIIGIAGHGDTKQVGRMGWKSLLYFEVVTTFALLFGLLAINLTRAGDNAALKAALATVDKSNGSDIVTQAAHTQQNWKDIVLHTFPENIAKSIAENQVLQVVVFTIFFAIAITMAGGEPKRKMLSFAESLAEVMFKFTKIVMYFAPFGVGGAMAFAVAKMGTAIFGPILSLVLTLYGALFFFVLLVLLPIAFFWRINLRKFWGAAQVPVSIAFSTASSEAALGPAIESMIKMGVPRKFVSFVLPTGMSFNLDGSTLYLAVAAVFVAQANGMELSIGTQITMLLTLMLTSKGIAGVARASLVILMGALTTFNIPDTPVYLILAVDALMDMARTSVNMFGNCLATVVIAKWENEYED